MSGFVYIFILLQPDTGQLGTLHQRARGAHFATWTAPETSVEAGVCCSLCHCSAQLELYLMKPLPPKPLLPPNSFTRVRGQRNLPYIPHSLPHRDTTPSANPSPHKLHCHSTQYSFGLLSDQCTSGFLLLSNVEQAKFGLPSTQVSFGRDQANIVSNSLSVESSLIACFYRQRNKDIPTFFQETAEQSKLRASWCARCCCGRSVSTVSQIYF